MGGALAQWFGMKNVFIITGVVLLITLLLTIFLVQEDFEPVEKGDLLSIKEILVKSKYAVACRFVYYVTDFTARCNEYQPDPYIVYS